MDFRRGTSCVCESVEDLLDSRVTTFSPSELVFADPKGSESSETLGCAKVPPGTGPEGICVSNNPRFLENL